MKFIVALTIASDAAVRAISLDSLSSYPSVGSSLEEYLAGASSVFGGADSLSNLDSSSINSKRDQIKLAHSPSVFSWEPQTSEIASVESPQEQAWEGQVGDAHVSVFKQETPNSLVETESYCKPGDQSEHCRHVKWSTDNNGKPSSFSSSCSWSEETSSWECPLDEHNNDAFGNALLDTIQDQIKSAGSSMPSLVGNLSFKKLEPMSSSNILGSSDLGTSDLSAATMMDLSSIGGEAPIDVKKITEDTDFKALDKLKPFTNDAAEEFNIKIKDDAKPKINGIEDVIIANMEHQIGQTMPDNPEIKIEKSMRMPDLSKLEIENNMDLPNISKNLNIEDKMKLPDLSGNPNTAISGIEALISGTKTSGGLGFFDFDFGSFGSDFKGFGEGFGKGFDNLDKLSPTLESPFSTQKPQLQRDASLVQPKAGGAQQPLGRFDGYGGPGYGPDYAPSGYVDRGYGAYGRREGRAYGYDDYGYAGRHGGYGAYPAPHPEGPYGYDYYGPADYDYGYGGYGAEYAPEYGYAGDYAYAGDYGYGKDPHHHGDYGMDRYRRGGYGGLVDYRYAGPVGY